MKILFSLRCYVSLTIVAGCLLVLQLMMINECVAGDMIYQRSAKSSTHKGVYWEQIYDDTARENYCVRANSEQKSSAPNDPDYHLVVDFTIPDDEPDSWYWVWLRVKSLTSSSDSIWMKNTGSNGAWDEWHFDEDPDWFWVNMKFPFASGANQLTIACREVGLEIDRIAIIKRAIDVNPDEYDPQPLPELFAIQATSSESLSLSWTDVSEDESGYEIQWRVLGETVWASILLDADISSYEHSGLEDITYEYRIKAKGDRGSSDWTTILFGNVTPLSVTIPYSTSFEDSEGYTAEGTHEPFELISGDSSISSVVASQGLQCLALFSSSKGSTIQLRLTGSPEHVGISMKPTLVDVETWDSSAVTNAPIQTAFVREGNRCRVYVFEGDGVGGGDWQKTYFTFNATGYESNEWLNLIFRVDYIKGVWDLFINESLCASGVGFPDSSQAGMEVLSISNLNQGTTYVDELIVTNEHPFLEDSDEDGFPDKWETLVFGTTHLGREDDPDHDGLTNKQEWDLGLNPVSVDSDHDGIPDGLEIEMGSNPHELDVTAKFEYLGDSNFGFECKFESSEGYRLEDVDEQLYWHSNAFTIDSGTGEGGSNALVLRVNENLSNEASFTVARNVHKDVWLSLDVDVDSGGVELEIDSLQGISAKLKIIDDGIISVYDSTVGWKNCDTLLTGDSFNKFTIHLNYTSHYWDLYVNGKAVTQRIGFVNDTIGSLVSGTIRGIGVDRVNQTKTLTLERWEGLSGLRVSDLTGNSRYPDSPDYVGSIPYFSRDKSSRDTYGERISGYIRPPESANYKFWLTSDDHGEFWLSTDENPRNKRKMAYVSGNTSRYEFDKYPSQESRVVSLEADKWYYVEVLHKEMNGSDHVMVSWEGGPIVLTRIWGTYISDRFSFDNMLTSPSEFVVDNLSVSTIRPAQIDDDTDSDGLVDEMEHRLGTNFNSSDTDGDGLSDRWEYLNGFDPLVASSFNIKTPTSLFDLGPSRFLVLGSDDLSEFSIKLVIPDGLIFNLDEVDLQWSVIHQPDGASLVFDDALSLTSGVSITTPGMYVLRFTIDAGESYVAIDEVTVFVSEDDPESYDYLIGLWNFEDLWDTVDSSIEDFSLWGNHASLVNVNPVIVWDGKGVEFSGNSATSNDLMRVPDGEYLINGLEEMTFSLWVQSNQDYYDNGFVNGGSSVSSDSKFGVRYDAVASLGHTEVITASIPTKGGYWRVESGHKTAIDGPTLHHYVVTFRSGENPEIYKDGERITSVVTNAPIPSKGRIEGLDQLIFGQGQLNRKLWWGQMDEIRIYGKAMSSDEVYELYYDSDQDGLGDSWERTAIISRSSDAYRAFIDIVPEDDIDGDGFNNKEEYELGLRPLIDNSLSAANRDSDGDGITDRWERSIIYADTSDDILGYTDVDPAGDYDGDGLSNLLEFTLSGDPTSTDSDGDGLGDFMEYLGGSDLSDNNSLPSQIQSNDEPPIIDGWQVQGISLEGTSVPYGFVNGTKLRLASPGEGFGVGDQLGYFTKILKDDYSLVVRISEFTDDEFSIGDAHVGLMVRTGLGAKDPFAAVSVSTNNKYFFHLREVANQTCESSRSYGNELDFPQCYLRIDKMGDVVRTYRSVDRFTWFEVGSTILDFEEEFYLGLFIYSGDSVNYARADIEDIDLLEHYDDSIVEDGLIIQPIYVADVTTPSASLQPWSLVGDAVSTPQIRNWIEYPITLGQAGVYRLAIDLSTDIHVHGNSFSEIAVSIDGIEIDRQLIQFDSESLQATMYVYLPYLEANHSYQIRLHWLSLSGTNTQELILNGLRIEGLSHANGDPVLIDSGGSSIDENAVITHVSPFCLEGETAFAGDLSLSGHKLNDLLNEIPEVTVIATIGDAYYSNISLFDDAPTVINVTDKGGLLSYLKQVTWIETPITNGLEMVVRKDDTVRFVSNAGEPCMVLIKNGDDDTIIETFSLVAGETLSYTFTGLHEGDIVENYIIEQYEDTRPVTPPKSKSLTWERWNGIKGTSISILVNDSRYPDDPDLKQEITTSEVAAEQGDYFGGKISGYLISPVTDQFKFWISSDDNGELWLSPDENPENKVLIASVPGHTDYREWTKFPEQESGWITLEKNKWYYVEALVKQDGGGDNLSFSWKRPSDTQDMVSHNCMSNASSFDNVMTLQAKADIHVVHADLGQTPSTVAGFAREWIPERLDPRVELQSDTGVQLVESIPQTQPRTFNLSIASSTPQAIVARIDLNENGIAETGEPIVDVTFARAITQDLQRQSRMTVVAINNDGSLMVEAMLHLDYVPEDLEIEINILRGGVLFADGSDKLIVTATDFDTMGNFTYYMHMVGAVQGGLCHQIAFKQGSVVIAN